VFSVDQNPIEIIQGFLQQHPHIKDAKEILEILFFYCGIPGGIGASVVKLMKWLKGDKPKEGQFTFTNNGTVIINLGDRQKETKTETFSLVMDRSVRAALEGMVAPLKRDGIETLDFYEEGVIECVEKITETEVDYFTAEELEGETLLDNTREAILSIVRLSFKEEHKWGFTDGTTKI